MSKKRASEMQKYNKAKARRPLAFCEFPDGGLGCIKQATQVHHLKGRAGGLLNDQRYWMLLCAEHHKWIHDHMKEARKLGLILWK